MTSIKIKDAYKGWPTRILEAKHVTSFCIDAYEFYDSDLDETFVIPANWVTILNKGE